MGSIMIELTEESVKALGTADFKRLHVMVAEEAYRRLKQVNDAHTDKHAQPAGTTATAKAATSSKAPQE